MIQPFLPLHECADPAATESATEPLHSIAESTPGEFAAEPLQSIAAPTEKS
jgi:hypothetical protein